MSNTNSIRSIPSVEVASSSDTNAPVFYFNQYNQSQEYFNNRERIDFVTYEGSLYVPGAERVVPETNDITRENFVLLVSRGPQGLPGIKGDPGRDGRTPSVFARFDGKQMIFYTNELNEDGTQKINERTGEPVIKRIAATNDLTGPSWRPKRVDDTIIWEKTRDDSQPESINLSDFVKETAPVIFRVDSDNTKRTDETSGPANYIQWKYEGDEYWNNLISISELMNLALAGVCIWFDEDDQEYHLGHRQVITATYDSSKTGKRIISDVEHGEVLYDAGPIHLPDFTADIAALWEELCRLKDRVDDIEEELPKFVKSVEGNRPDENGDVKLPGFVKSVEVNGEIHLPDENGKVELPDYYTKEESDNKYLTPDDLDFELVKDDNGIKLYVTIAGVRKEVGYTCDCKGHEPTPTTVPVTGVTITNCVSSLKVGQTGTIVWSVSPNNATDKSVTFTSSNTSVATVSSTGVVTANAVGSAVITVKTTDGNYTDTCNVTVTNDDEPTIVPVSSVSITNCVQALTIGETNTIGWVINPSNATNKNVTITSSDTNVATVDNTGKVTARATGVSTITVRTVDGGKRAQCTVHVAEDEPETYTFTIIPDPSDATVVIEDVTRTSLSGLREGSTVNWSVSKSGYEPRSGSWTMTDANKDLPVTLDPISPTPTTTYTLTINGNGGTVKYRINNGPQRTYSSVLTLNDGDSVKLNATRNGHTINRWEDVSTDRTALSPSNNEFTMIKDTSINITWTEVTPGDVQVSEVIIGNKPTDNKLTWDCSSSQDHTLTVTFNEDATVGKSVTWSSSRTSVAKFEDNTSGKFTVVGPGETTIKATSVNGTEGSFKLTVNEPAVTSITLNKSALSLTVGQEETLSVESYEGGCTKPTVTWSSDPNVATVDSNGKVTAVAAGNTTITAKVGTNGPTADCTVIVTSGIIAVTGVSLNKSSINVNASCDETQTTSETLTATVIPENASNKRVTWSSNNENVVEVSTNGIVTPVASGVATVTVTTEDGNKTADCEVTVTNITNVSSMTINKTTSTLDIGGTDTLRILTIEPDCVEVTWNSDNTNVATVTPGSMLDKRATVTAEGAGTARITATAGDNRKTVNCIVTVNEPGKGIWFKNNSNLISIEVAAGSDGSISLYPQGNAQYINLHSGNVLTFTTDNAYEYIYLTGNAGGCTVPTKLRNGGTITYQNAPTDGCSTENDPILVTVQESGSDTPENTIAD